MTFNQSIGDQIRSKRKSMKIPSNVVAEYLGRSNSTYTSYERGLTTIGIDDFVKVCNYLGLNMDEVVKKARENEI